MALPYTKAVVGALWILAAGAIAATGGELSMSRVMFFVGFGLVPPLLMLVLWSPPQKTLSESIQEARR